MAEAFSLKDALFNADKVAYLAGLFAAKDPGFDSAGFQSAVMARLPELELKARILWISEVLSGHLPTHFTAAADVIEAALPPPLDPAKSDDDFGDFILAPLSEYVAEHGLNTEDLPRALDLLEALTQRFSVEFAIRPFLNTHPEAVMDRVRLWAKHPNYHVRRLASEGTRPRLPWGAKVGLDPLGQMDVLDVLHRDKTRYVTRSVANHLNDIAKLDGDAVVAVLARWQRAGQQEAKELNWMIRHALRSLIKDGHGGAMALLGFVPDPPVTLGELRVSDTVQIGGALSFEFDVLAQADAGLLVDFVLTFAKQNGGTRRKVFKLKTVQMAAGERLTLQKNHAFRGGASTFSLWPGPHRLAIQINGVERLAAGFELTA